MATIKDIASKLGLSTSTVSVVLRGKAAEMKISEETQKKIWDTARALEYQPNISARRLRSVQERIIYIVVYYSVDYRAYYMIRFLAGLRERAKMESFKVEFIIKQYETLSETFEISTFYHAAIVCNASSEDLEYLEALPPTIPIVVYNRESTRYATVCVDNKKLGTMAVDIFKEKGVKNVVLITSPALYQGMDELCMSFLDIARHNGIQTSVITLEDDSMANGARAADIYKDKQLESEAVFVTSSYLSHGALNAFLRMGVDIPNKMKFLSVGSGLSTYDEYALISISTLDIPREKMAARCLEIALKLANKELDGIIQEKYAPVYMPRESC